jgi:hypothetical protein
MVTLLALQAQGILAGSCLSGLTKQEEAILRDPDGQTGPDAAGEVRDPCKNGRPLGGWACAKAGMKFPTLACLEADMKLCGNINTGPSVFYSFGANAGPVRTNVAEKLLPNKGVMYNSVLGIEWYDDMNKDRVEVNGVLKSRSIYWGLDTADGRVPFLSLATMAMARVSEGTVYMVSKSRTSANTESRGGQGAYQSPRVEHMGRESVWIDCESPELQRNPKIAQVINLANKDNSDTSFSLQTVDWTPALKRAGKRKNCLD